MPLGLHSNLYRLGNNLSALLLIFDCFAGECRWEYMVSREASGIEPRTVVTRQENDRILITIVTSFFGSECPRNYIVPMVAGSNPAVVVKATA